MMRLTTIGILAAFLLGACSSTSTPKEESFSVNLESVRYDAGTIEAYFEPSMSLSSDVRKNENIAVYYHPVEDAVCLQFKIQFAECKQFWDKDGREAFVRALEQYKGDYEQKNLSKGSKRTTGRAYGETPGFFAWKKSSVGIQAHGSTTVDFGYFIQGRSAFFATAQSESFYEDHINKARNQLSPVIRMYFTRAQAEGLASLFDEGFLSSLRSSRNGLPVNTGKDEYEEL